MLFDDGEKELDALLNQPLVEAKDAKGRLMKASQHDPSLHRLFMQRHYMNRTGDYVNDADFFAMVALAMLRTHRISKKILLDHMNTCAHRTIIFHEPA